MPTEEMVNPPQEWRATMQRIAAAIGEETYGTVLGAIGILVMERVDQKGPAIPEEFREWRTQRGLELYDTMRERLSGPFDALWVMGFLIASLMATATSSEDRVIQ